MAEAKVAMQKNEEPSTTLLEDVLKVNGEEHLYDTIMKLSVHAEEAPPLIFEWLNVEDFVTVENVNEAVLEFARDLGAPARLDTTCLPCSMMQCTRVASEMQRMDFDPWIQRVVAVCVPRALPIACVYVPRPRSNTLDRAFVQHPNGLWG